jgi:hypothetical protein
MSGAGPLALLFGALLAVASGGMATANVAGDPRNLTLRLPDLGRGYLVGDDSGCGVSLFEEGAPGSLRRLDRPRGCTTQFERLWTAPGVPTAPALVESSALVFRRAAGADAGVKVGRDLIAYIVGLVPRSLDPVHPSSPIGDATVVYRTDGALVEGVPGNPGVAILWRTGRVVSLVFVADRAGAAGEEAALWLAAVQQGRIESPTPLRPRQNDDREVPLDNPQLGIDVHWLGRRFQPQGGLPPLVLEASFGPIERGGGPGWLAEVDYETRRSPAGVKLGLWKPRAWARFRRTRLGGLVWRQPCAHARRLRLPAGRAVIYAGYAERQKRCGRRRRDAFLAHVYLPQVVVSVNIPHCFLCVPRGGRSDPYNSLAGVTAIVRGLRLRPAAP